MNEVARTKAVPLSLDQMLAQADMFVKSQFFPKAVDTKEKACVIMIKGKELGLPFTEALSKINIIAGVAVTKVETMLGLAQAKGLIEDMKIVEKDDYCEVTIKRKGQTAFTCRFGDVDATRITTSEWVSVAGKREKEKVTIKLIEKDNYKKQKNVMYRWRAIAMNLRVTCPDAIGGLYLEEEIAHDVVIDENQQVTEIIDRPHEHTDQIEHAPDGDATTLRAEDIPEESLGNWVMPIGKYTGQRLTEIAFDVTDTGKQKGLEYLQWCVENWKKPTQAEMVATIQRFLEKNESSISREAGAEG